MMFHIFNEYFFFEMYVQNDVYDVTKALKMLNLNNH